MAFIPVSLELNSQDLGKLPEIAPNVTYLRCGYNKLETIPTLPSGLTGLECPRNQINSLPELPEGLWNLDASKNKLNTLPKLPLRLKYLSVNGNDLFEMPELPPTLGSLSCANNPNLTRLPKFPPEMTFLSCGGSPIKDIPELPSRMKSLYVGSPRTVPPFPKNVEMLVISTDRLDDDSFKHVLDHLPRLAPKQFADVPYRGTVVDEILRCTQHGHRMRVLKYMYESPYFDNALVTERKVKTVTIHKNLRQMMNADVMSYLMSFVF
jgi:hypothetical protein